MIIAVYVFYLTYRGVTIGDSVEKVFLTYGNSSLKNNRIRYEVMYQRKNEEFNRWETLNFGIDDAQKVKAIEIRQVYD